MSFIDKRAILESVFIDEYTGRILRPNIYSQEFERDTFTVLLSPYGVEIKYYTDDKLYEKFGDELPDNINGEVLVFFYTPDAIKIIEELSAEVKQRVEIENKKRKQERFERYGI